MSLESYYHTLFNQSAFRELRKITHSKRSDVIHALGHQASFYPMHPVQWTPNALEKIAQKALDQIVKKQYAQAFYKQGVKMVICYGRAFEGKQVFVKTLELHS